MTNNAYIVGTTLIIDPYGLSHHGIKGMKWGVRRYQNPDGTLTAAGKRKEARDLKKEERFNKKAEKLRRKDLSRYDKALSRNISDEERLSYTALRSYTEKASAKEVMATSPRAKSIAVGAGIATTIGLSLTGKPNIISIPVGIAIAKSISNTQRDNYRIGIINGEPAKHYDDDSPVFLSHHGILGQKWGVRRFQDAAGRLTALGKKRLESGKHSDNKIKMESIKSIGSKRADDAGTPSGGGGATWEDLDQENYQLYMDWFKSLSDEELEKMGIKRSDIDAVKNKEDMYDLIQKYRKVETHDSGKIRLLNDTVNALFSNNLLSVLDPMITLGSAATAKFREGMAELRKSKEPIDPKTGLHVKSDKDASKIDDMKNVNPGFTDLSDNTKNNCMLCTTTYDLRRRGYDVTAERVRSGYQEGDLKRWYPDAKIEHVRVRDEEDTAELISNTKRDIAKQGDGARGNLMVSWKQGGGHSMAYEVENGNVIIYDCQTGTRYDDAETILQYTDEVSYARLDNVRPDYTKVKEACK